LSADEIAFIESQVAEHDVELFEDMDAQVENDE
jgi:hypothetical protein